jgi:hypothetical protein
MYVTTIGLDISQGTEANGHGALSDWPCALKNSFHIFHLPRPCPAEMALKMGALQFSYVKSCNNSRIVCCCTILVLPYTASRYIHVVSALTHAGPAPDLVETHKY